MMRLFKYLLRILAEAFRYSLFYIRKRDYVFSPVFIIGCGRSGTTILGNTLSEHSEIKYLNERRDLWHASYPEFDVWNKDSKESKIYVDDKDISSKKNKILHDLFFREQVLSRSKILLDKLPINSFRLRFLEKSFPNARYIYLTRNGLEVSKSIDQAILQGNWLRSNDLLNSFSIKNRNQNKGMWEWKLSISHSDDFFKSISKKRFIHLSYKDFIDYPSKTLKEILDFLNLDYSEEWIKEISKSIKRKTPEIKKDSDKNLYIIGGDILTETIANSYHIE